MSTANSRPRSLGQVGRNLLTVLGNWRFVLFLAIFSGYWIVFWQQYLSLPIFIHDYVDPKANTEMILIADPIIVITLTVAVNALTRRISSFGAITLGTLITGVAWIIFGAHPAVWTAVVALVIVALERSRSSRDTTSTFPAWLRRGSRVHTWVSRSCRSASAHWLAGAFAGWLLHHYGEVQHRPERVWWAITAVGVATAALLWIYDLFVMKKSNVPANSRT